MTTDQPARTPEERARRLLGGAFRRADGAVWFPGLDGDGFDVFVSGLVQELAAHAREVEALRSEVKKARDDERQAYRDLGEAITQRDAARADNAGLREELAALRASHAAHECRCKNDPCPVCGGGPSGEWFDGSEVRCDGCGSMLYVEVAEECHGRSRFSLADARCADCGGEGFFDALENGNEHTTRDCKACSGSGYRETTVEEARKAAGLPALASNPGERT